MSRIMLFIGGIINLLLGVFHCLFWKLFDWETTTSVLPAAGRATYYILNIQIIVIVFAFSFISIFYHQELIKISLGRAMLFIISLFYIIRALNQAIFYYFDSSMLFGSIAFSAFLIGIALLYLIPFIKSMKAEKVNV